MDEYPIPLTDYKIKIPLFLQDNDFLRYLNNLKSKRGFKLDHRFKVGFKVQKVNNKTIRMKKRCIYVTHTNGNIIPVLDTDVVTFLEKYNTDILKLRRSFKEIICKYFCENIYALINKRLKENQNFCGCGCKENLI